MQCAKCGRKLSRFSKDSVNVWFFDKEDTMCKDCYEQLETEYNTKKTCENCFYFDESGEREFCKKLGFALEKTRFGVLYEGRVYFFQAEECVHYIAKKDYEKKAS